ncbi:MAG: PP2C family serine/threonine-protein phosphatase, partial [Verrucomicrobium sp.]
MTQLSKKAPLRAPGLRFELEKDFSGRQHIGQREKQEDYYAFSDVSEKMESPFTRLLVGLGDGLGAHVGGNVASYLLISEFVKAYKRSGLTAAWRLRVALEAANEALHHLSLRLQWSHAPMGSTFIGLMIAADHAHWISVGDSPLFLFRAGELLRLNADHSLAPLLDDRVRRGEITPQEALTHPDRHVLQSACMGLPLTLVDARMEKFPLQPGDILVAASDGILTLSKDAIRDLLAFGIHTSAAKIADALLFAVRGANHPRQDNTTIAV